MSASELIQIRRFHPRDLDDAARAANSANVPAQDVAAHRDDARQIRMLIDQSRNALPQAVQDGELQAAAAAAIGQSLDAAAVALGAADLPETERILQQICTRTA